MNQVTALDAFRIFFFSFILNAPFYILCSLPFLSKLRVKRSVLFTMIILTTMLVALYYTLRNYFLPGQRGIDSIVVVFFYIIYMFEYLKAFDISFPKLFYIFLVVHAYSNILNITAKYLDVVIFLTPADIFSAWGYGFIYLLLIAITYPILYLFFKNRINDFIDSISDKQYWLLCITPILFFIINLVFSPVFIKYAFNDLLIFIIYLLILISGLIIYFVTILTSVNAASNARLESEMQNIEKQLKIQGQSYLKLRNNIEETRAARHDLRHHLAVMNGYIENNDREGLKEYLDSYIKILPSENEVPYCENYAINLLIKHYLSYLNNQDVVLDIEVSLPHKINISDSDLSIVFGNILENAVHGITNQSEGEKFLTLHCKRYHGKLVLTLDNSCDYRKIKKSGIGQQSVLAVAKKYHGTAKFESDGNVYKSSVILNYE